MPHPTIETPETLREFAPHALPADAVARQLGTSPDGLSLEEARRRLHQFGANEIEGIKPISIPALILHQFASPLIYILLVAAVVTLLLGEYIDTAVIAAVLALRDRLAFLLLRQPTHEPPHTRPLYPTRRHLAQPIITTRQPTTTQQPRKTTRHQPTTLQHHKTLPRTKHTVQRHTKLPQQPRQQTLLVIRPVRDHYLRRRIPTQHRLQHPTRPARVRHIRRRDPYPKHTALRAHHKMLLAPFHFLAPVIPACPPFAVDGTL